MKFYLNWHNWMLNLDMNWNDSEKNFLNCISKKCETQQIN